MLWYFYKHSWSFHLYGEQAKSFQINPLGQRDIESPVKHHDQVIQAILNLFSWEFCEISTNTVSYRTHLVAASIWRIYCLDIFCSRGKTIKYQLWKSINHILLLQKDLYYNYIIKAARCCWATQVLTQVQF